MPARGVELVDVYEELDRSGGDAARPLWNRAIERIEAGRRPGVRVQEHVQVRQIDPDARRAIDRIEAAGGRLLSEEAPRA